jgi:hypothetical protein
MNFQAMEFYQKFGFELEYTRSGFEHNFVLHFLKKDIWETSEATTAMMPVSTEQ